MNHFLIFLVFLVSPLSPHAAASGTPEARACAVFCHGPLLETLQRARLPQFGNDSKSFVDAPLLADPETVLAVFAGLPANPPDNSALARFARTYFGPVESDLLMWAPPDWQPSAPLLVRAKQQHTRLWTNTSLRNWTQSIHSLWHILGRQIAPSVALAPERHTLLPTPHPLIVPGGRFRESYYWDSYWIVRGLELSGMNDTAAGIVDNLLDFVRRYGFVPNGGRAYYLSRSQPPLLSEMVRSLFIPAHGNGGGGGGKRSSGATASGYGDSNGGSVMHRSMTALRSRLPLLQAEHAFWIRQRTMHDSNAKTGSLTKPKYHNTIIRGRNLPPACDPQEALRTLQHYDANTTLPRPESWREDAALRAMFPTADQPRAMRDVAAAAESGWDFSSRWFADGTSMRTIHTTRILPVELNAVMVRMERNICRLRASLSDRGGGGDRNGGEDPFCAQSKARWHVIETCMWSEGTQRWNDLLVVNASGGGGTLTTLTQTNVEHAAVSNWVPMWVAGDSHLAGDIVTTWNTTRLASAARRLREESGLFLPGGLSTTNVRPRTGQQWDWPNAWAPLQDWIIEGLSGCAKLAGMSVDDARFMSSFSRDLTSRWLNSTLLAFQKTGFMFEKYDATKVGYGGGGGEYVPQMGFGWTNGVALRLLADLPEL
jgi:alpha,alpha-trehalase